MFILPKKFENTLRSPIIPATPANPGSGLNPAFHKGCTGKSHACGTIKTKLNKPIPPPRGDKIQRKNSISSDTISDSGSEIYNSTLCNVINSSIGGGSIDDAYALKNIPKEREANVQNVKKCLNSKSPLPPSRINKISNSPVLKRSLSTSGTRIRLRSEGEQNSECDRQSPVNTTLSTFERTQKYRSFRTNNKLNGNKNTVTPSSNLRPPWNSAAAGMKTTSTITSNTVNARTLRSSLRHRKEAVSWHTILERSLQMRGYGSSINSGYLKNYDDILKRKV